MTRKTTYILGYGNSLRGDDGVGPACVERLRRDGTDGILLCGKTHLTIDDSFDIAGAETTIFVDACVSGGEPFVFHEVTPVPSPSFSSCLATPGFVLYLCRRFFNPDARAFLLAIRGYTWDTGEGLSPRAAENLTAACGFLRDILSTSFYRQHTRTIHHIAGHTFP